MNSLVAGRHWKATRRRVCTAGAILALTLLSYFAFPGHTWLQADTQIYVPILERLYDPAVLAKDPVAQRPHVAFTIYDEVTLALRRLTGLDLHATLTFQQLVFRAMGILGAYLLATALGLSGPMALLVAGTYSLGATVVGPAVLTIEYEPVPRGFAGPLVLLALGLAGRGRDLAAGAAATLAFLYHPPTAAAFWGLYFLLALWPAPPAVMTRRIAGLAPLAVGVLLLFAASRWQPGVSEPQILFSPLEAELEQLQRWRAPYNWISLWDAAWIRQHVFLWLVALGAFWRLRRLGAFSQSADLAGRGLRWPIFDLEFFLLGLPLVGLLCIPLSYVLLERMKWALAAQLQPARNLLYMVALAGILAAAAAVKAGERRRWWEAWLWFLVVFAIPAHMRLLQFTSLELVNPLSRRRVFLVAALAASSTLAVLLMRSGRRAAVAACTLAGLLPFFAIPSFGKVRNYPNLHARELDELAAWARSSTPPEAVFLFPDAGRELFPGIFRGKALRALYVDWKSGGQVNFLRGFAAEWRTRWQLAMEGGFRSAKVEHYASLGVDYVVLRRPRNLPGRKPVYENSRFVVYKLEHSAGRPSPPPRDGSAVPR